MSDTHSCSTHFEVIKSMFRFKGYAILFRFQELAAGLGEELEVEETFVARYKCSTFCTLKLPERSRLSSILRYTLFLNKTCSQEVSITTKTAYLSWKRKMHDISTRSPPFNFAEQRNGECRVSSTLHAEFVEGHELIITRSLSSIQP